MFALDLFNNDHERRLAEGAVDQLEQRRIDDLAMKMDDLVARAKQANTPESKQALMKEFQKCKAERDSYFKIRNETMGYGTLVGETEEDWYDANGRPDEYGCYDAGGHYHAEREEDMDAGYDAYKERDWTDESGIPGNVPTEKIPGKEDLLRGKGRSYYESTQLDEYIVRSGDDISSVMSLNLFNDLLSDAKLSSYDEEFANSPEWQAVVDKWAPKAEFLQQEIYKYQNAGRKLRDAEADAIDATAYDGSDAYEDAETAANYLPKIYARQAAAIVRLLKDGYANPDATMHEASRSVDIATQDQLDHDDAMSARAFDRNQGRIQRQRGNLAAGVDVGRWLKPYQLLVKNNFEPVETKDRFEYLMQVALKLKGTNAGFSGDTGMSHAARIFGLQHQEQKLVANLVRNCPSIRDLENYTRDEVAETGSAQAKTDDAFRAHLEKVKREKQSGVPSSVPVEKIPGKSDLLKGKGRGYYESQKKNSEKIDESNMSELDAMRQDLERMNDRQFYTAYGISKAAFQQKYRTLLKPALDEGRLNVGDPIVVIGPNEFEGKTGEIEDFSPSGSFVVVNLYNHGRHSMHLSDITYNEYADQEQDEEDDWYDDEEVDEGFQDFNKVEPYEVCLAGKPVKTFDYYEDARRFHDNWKQKLYREGNKEKADKITLNPIMDEAYQYPSSPEAVAKQKATINRPASTSTDKVKTFAAQGYTIKFKPDVVEIYHGANLVYSKPGNFANPTRAQLGAIRGRVTDLVNRKKKEMAEAGNPAQQAAIAIAKKKEQGVAEDTFESIVAKQGITDERLLKVAKLIDGYSVK